MRNFMNYLIKKRNYNLLSVLFVAFLVMDVEIPHFIASLLDNIVGKVVLIFAAVALLATKHFVGLLGLLVAYELIRRSSVKTGSGPIKQYVPSENHKMKELKKLNEFSTSLEEETVNNMVSYPTSRQLSRPEYKPQNNSKNLTKV